jgi:hypothetical protein
MLDSGMQLSKSEEALLSQLLNQLPQLLRYGLMMTGKKAAATLPPLSTGRKPTLTARQSQDALGKMIVLTKSSLSKSLYHRASSDK